MSGLRLPPSGRPALALAPMQEVTDLPFWNVTCRYGKADFYFTEYFRVHPTSHLEKDILRSIDQNPTGRPVIAQMIGRDIPSLVRSARELQNHNVAGVDLNLGCPAPVVCSKNAGGALLRDLAHIDAILGALRDAVDVSLTVKTRIGFEASGEFDALLEVFSRHAIDALSVHGRTVREKYASSIHLDRIRQAVETLPCPVFANGNVVSVNQARLTLNTTGAAGLMIGRGAIRNPWLFAQIRQDMEPAGPSTETPEPTLRDLHRYVVDLFHAIPRPGASEQQHIRKMKRYMNYIGQGIDEQGEFLYRIRRASTKCEFMKILDEFLLSDRALAPEPPRDSALFQGLTPMGAP